MTLNGKQMRRTIAAIVVAVIGASVAASAQDRPVAGSWYGDPASPDLSGVWARVDAPTSVSASKEGWTPWPPPLKGDFATTYAKRTADPAARTDDPVVTCQPPGMPRVTTGTNGPLLIMQTPGRVTMYRDGIPVRRIWLDGRAQPTAKDIESFSNGNAIGHYEGGDLVTDVIGIKDQPIDSTGVPHSDALKITERYHRVDAHTLRVSVTLTDAVAYTRPITTNVTYSAWQNPLWEPREFLCKPKTDYHPDKYVH